MKQEMVMISREEYEQLKKQAEIDMDILRQFISSLKDLKEGRIRRVK